MKHIERLLLVAAFLCFLPPLAVAQFPSQHPDGVSMPSQAPGAVALGGPMLKSDGGGSVVVVQPQPPSSGGVIHLSALGWLAPYADSIVQGLIALGFAWLGKSKYSSMMDQSARDALEIFLKNRASSLVAAGAVRMEGLSVRVNSGLLYQAANDAMVAIPGALKRFGLSPQVVASKIVAAIPQVPAMGQVIADAHAVVAATPADPNAPPTAPAT